MLSSFVIGLLFAPQANIITTKSLVENRFDFAGGSGPRFVQSQASSYSPTSKTPGNEAWFANDDYGHYVRQDGKEYVMADLIGPGAVVRMWSANPFGTLRMYFDGETEPRIKVPMKEWVDELRNQSEGLQKWAFWADRGWNIYFPFLYQKSLKITMEPGEKENPGSLYYHVGYRSYVAGTSVKTFESSDLSANYSSNQGNTAIHTTRVVQLLPREAKSSVRFVGPGMIRRIHLPWSAANPTFYKVLREIWVTGSFDGETTIQAPLGDLLAAPFGYGTQDGLDVDLAFDMPYKREARFTFDRRTSADGVPVTLVFSADKSLNGGGTPLNYFHADFSRDRGRTRPVRDMHWLDVQGSGYLAGCHLLMANPVKGWWGEGDEKIYVDGESFPSTFGTGTEDFLNYAWSSPIPFWTPMGSQNFTTTRSNNFGYCNVSRMMTRDPIPFTKSLKFDVEMWHWNDCVATWDRVVYWYGAKGVKVVRQPRPSWKELELPDFPDNSHYPGAIEAEKLSFAKTDGITEIQGGFGEMSGDNQIWWRDMTVGSKLKVEVPHADGEYELVINACFARDYGIHQLYWNGEKLGAPIDFYDPSLLWKQVKLGKVRILGGKATLTAESVGANAKAEPRRMFGLDYLLLKKL